MRALCVEDYERDAHERLDPRVWDFVAGGGGAERTLAANRDAFNRVRIRPRVLVDVAARSTATGILGAPLAAPIGVAPTAYHRMLHPDGEVATAAGAGKAGALFVVSIFASRTLTEIAAAASGPLWLQIYWLRQREALVDLAQQAADSGFGALVLTVDAPVIGQRHRDLRNAFAVSPDISAVNLDRAFMAAAHHPIQGESALANHAEQSFDTTVTWSDLAWLRSVTSLPLVLKGILTAEDAARAMDHGVDGVIVSNHGGRQLDGVEASLDALPEVVDAVGGRAPVLFDGGVRCGTDVFTALACGADLVLVGRPALWALACDGASGVAHLLEMLGRELSHTMALAGRPTLSDIDASAVTARPRGTRLP